MKFSSVVHHPFSYPSLSAYQTPLLVRVSIAATKNHGQINVGSLFGLHFHGIVQHHRKSGQDLEQGRKLEADADTEAREEFCLLALHGLFIFFSYESQDHQLREDPTHNKLGSPPTHQ